MYCLKVNSNVKYPIFVYDLLQTKEIFVLNSNRVCVFTEACLAWSLPTVRQNCARVLQSERRREAS